MREPDPLAVVTALGAPRSACGDRRRRPPYAGRPPDADVHDLAQRSYRPRTARSQRIGVPPKEARNGRAIPRWNGGSTGPLRTRDRAGADGRPHARSRRGGGGLRSRGRPGGHTVVKTVEAPQVRTDTTAPTGSLPGRRPRPPGPMPPTTRRRSSGLVPVKALLEPPQMAMPLPLPGLLSRTRPLWRRQSRRTSITPPPESALERLPRTRPRLLRRSATREPGDPAGSRGGAARLGNQGRRQLATRGIAT